MKIYYAHSIELYFSEIETEDLIFLSCKGSVTNPRDIKLKNMIDYIYLVKDHDVIYYRGATWGVAFEVLSGLAFGIPVYSLDTKRKLSKKQQKEIAEIFKNSIYYEDDVRAFKINFPDYFDNFRRMTDELVTSSLF